MAGGPLSLRNRVFRRILQGQAEELPCCLPPAGSGLKRTKSSGQFSYLKRRKRIGQKQLTRRFDQSRGPICYGSYCNLGREKPRVTNRCGTSSNYGVGYIRFPVVEEESRGGSQRESVIRSQRDGGSHCFRSMIV